MPNVGSAPASRMSMAAGCCRHAGAPPTHLHLSCARGQLHASLYLVRNRQGAAALCDWEACVHQAVAAYQQLQRLLDEVGVNGSGSEAAGRNDVLRRLLHYAEKVYGLRDSLGRRRRHQAAAAHPDAGGAAVGAGAVLDTAGQPQRVRDASARTVLETVVGPRDAQRRHPRARYSRLDAAAVRAAIHHVYERLSATRPCPGSAGWAWPCSTAMSLTPATAVAVEDA